MRGMAGIALPLAERWMGNLIALLRIGMTVETECAASFFQQVALLAGVRVMTSTALSVANRGMQHRTVGNRLGDLFVASETELGLFA